MFADNKSHYFYPPTWNQFVQGVSKDVKNYDNKLTDSCLRDETVSSLTVLINAFLLSFLLLQICFLPAHINRIGIQLHR